MKKFFGKLMPYILPFVVLLGACTGALIGAAAVRRERTEMYEKGMALLEQGEYREGLDILRDIGEWGNAPNVVKEYEERLYYSSCGCEDPGCQSVKLL